MLTDPKASDAEFRRKIEMLEFLFRIGVQCSETVSHIENCRFPKLIFERLTTLHLPKGVVDILNVISPFDQEELEHLKDILQTMPLWSAHIKDELVEAIHSATQPTWMSAPWLLFNSLYLGHTHRPICA
jgi:hypothetical protein